MPAPAALAAVFQDLLAADADASSRFLVPGTGQWVVEAFFAGEPDIAALQEQVARLATALAVVAPRLAVERVPERDWLAEVERQTPPVVAGRFFVHGRHDRGRRPASGLAIEIDPGRAFGTGRHDSTKGCLLALDRLARRRRFRRVLDLGCGSGILAIATIKLWRARTIATDIDPLAASETRRNARVNAALPWLRPLVADGFRHRSLARRRRHDLILANILARPLIRLSGEIVRRLAPGGQVVLAGLLSRQAPAVLAAYRAHGCRLALWVRLGDWPTLVLTRTKRCRLSPGAGIMPPQ